MFTVHQGNRILLVSSALLLLVFALSFFFLFEGEGKSNSPYFAQNSQKAVEKKISSLEGPALALNKRKPDFETVDLKQALEASVLPLRPTEEKQELCLSLGIVAQKRPKTSSLGQKIYLGLDGSKKLSFSRSKTPFWVIPREITESQVILDVEGDFSGVDQRPELDHQIVLFPKAKVFLKPQDLKKTKKYKDFSEITWVVPDQLQQLIHPEKELKHRLLIGRELLEISEGDLISKESNQWKVLQGKASSSPLVRVFAIHDRAIEFEGWSASDIGGVYFKIPEQVSVPLSVGSKDFIRDVRLKTHQQISCRIENQNLNLKIGDWVLKTQGAWTVLNTQNLVDSYLKHETEGLLFVFQGIEQVKGEKVVLGYLFDKLCTQKLKLEVPIKRKKPKQSSLKSSINTSAVKGQKR